MHNGYTNYPTWAVALWIDNDYGLHTEPERIALECAERVRAGGNEFAESEEQAIRLMLADALKEWANETFMAAPPTGLVGDLLSYAWGAVDWSDLARHYMLDVDFSVQE